MASLTEQHLGKYYIGGRLIVANDAPRTEKVIINTNPIDYESILISDEKWHNIFDLQSVLDNVEKQSLEKMSEERNAKLKNLYNVIRHYKAEYVKGKNINYDDYGNIIDEGIRYLQIEFPKYESKGKTIIYNKHIDNKPVDFFKYFIESDIDLEEIQKILFDTDNEIE